ncbi:MAG: succinate dehydrogenase assembly factor 2 [Gammaproteobacteria bacterium]
MSAQSRLLWRCRRGVKEMDLLLEAFVSRVYPGLGEEEKRQFELFLEETDPDILSWVMGRSEPGNPAYKEFVEQLRTINAANPSMDKLKDDV